MGIGSDFGRVGGEVWGTNLGGIVIDLGESGAGLG